MKNSEFWGKLRNSECVRTLEGSLNPVTMASMLFHSFLLLIYLWLSGCLSVRNVMWNFFHFLILLSSEITRTLTFNPIWNNIFLVDLQSFTIFAKNHHIFWKIWIYVFIYGIWTQCVHIWKTYGNMDQDHSWCGP